MKRLKLIFACLFISVGLAFAQSTKITGTVVDEKGEPSIGASVQLKGSKTGTITDLNGKFTIAVPNSKSVLIFSSVGYVKIELVATQNMKVVLKEDAQMLDAVVVTGMMKVDKRLFTGATDKLTAEKTRIDGLSDVSRALEGRSAGVSVQNISGTFGTAPKIRIRGATSIYGSSKPLWVVDGVIMEDAVEVSADDLSSGDAITLISSAIAGLSADDIESFQILKDGSATSIYGAKAMAGVVVITTKRGKAGVSKINYTGEFTSRLKPSYNDFNLMNSKDQMSIYKELEDKGWLNFSDSYRASNSGVYGKMYQLINDYKGNGVWGLANTVEARNQYLQSAEMRNTDWFDELFNTNIVQNHAISISSGTERARYYTSLSMMEDPGWSKSSSVRRYTANANASFSISKALTLNLLTNGSYRKQKAPGTLNQSVDLLSGEVNRGFDINPYSYALNTSRTLAISDENGYTYYTRNYAPFNILDELKNNYIDLDIADLKFQGELNWKIVPGLEINGLAAVKYQQTTQQHNIKDYSNQAMAYRAAGDATIRDRNPLLYKDPDAPIKLPETILPEGGILDKKEYKMLGYDFRATVTYNKDINDKHLLNFFSGVELNSIDRSQYWSRGWGYQYDKGGIPFYDYRVFKQASEQNNNYYSNGETYGRSLAYFANMAYSFDGKYIVNGTFRYEGTNRLGKSRSARWLPTWNISGAWNAHEEAFFENIKPVISHLTLKSSYSLTADRGPAFVTNSHVVYRNYSPYRPFAGVKEAGAEIDGLENSELTYEKKHEFNVGAEFGFLNNRINFSTDVYFRNNFDLIGLIETQGVGGEVIKYANVASMKSNGVEMTLSTKNIQTKNFSWSTDFIFSKTKNEVTDLKSRANVMSLISGTGFAKEGYPVRGLFSIPFMGLNEDGFPTFLNQKGMVTVSDINFQENNNVNFLKYEGPTDPTITGSFGNIFTYKNFRANVFFTYSFGNVIRLDPVFSSQYSDLNATPKEFKNRWMVPGDEAHTTIPVIASKRQSSTIANLNYAYNAYNYSDARIAKGDFIRLKEISVSYDFPMSVINKLKLSSLQLKLQATNLFLIYADSKLNGQDPEFFRSGGVSAPIPRQFTFTLRLGI